MWQWIFHLFQWDGSVENYNAGLCLLPTLLRKWSTENTTVMSSTITTFCYNKHHLCPPNVTIQDISLFILLTKTTFFVIVRSAVWNNSEICLASFSRKLSFIYRKSLQAMTRSVRMRIRMPRQSSKSRTRTGWIHHGQVESQSCQRISII